jgi:CRP-like cAMP-binding protein
MNAPPGGRTEWTANSLLSTLPNATTTELLSLGTSCEFDAGQVLVREDDTSTHVYVLLTGCTKVTATTPEGGFALLAIRGGGDVIGELAGLDGQPRSATVTTVNRVRARVLSQATFQNFLSRHPDAALAISRSVGAKLRWATRRRVDFSGREVRVRLARVLVELAGVYGLATSDGVELGVALTQPELAGLVSAAEPTVHRALAGFRRHRLISIGYRRTVITDLPALRAVAGLDPH